MGGSLTSNTVTTTVAVEVTNGTAKGASFTTITSVSVHGEKTNRRLICSRTSDLIIDLLHLIRIRADLDNIDQGVDREVLVPLMKDSLSLYLDQDIKANGVESGTKICESASVSTRRVNNYGTQRKKVHRAERLTMC
ncbi:hypothetical protein CCH79_00001221, partial [Gambusia affinis]